MEPEEQLRAAQLLEVAGQSRVQERGVRRVVFVYHGIRDYGIWTGAIKKQIATAALANQSDTVASTPKYGYFPMLSFLLYRDRQRNVRSFMDEYTEALARYPDLADDVDYVGHSNGTYILASALHHYRTIRVRNVFFAGSVVPRLFDWQRFIDAGRVAQVRNVVASADWVVAYFPRFFEQIADWANKKPETGMFDIGSAGFRGFAAAGDPGNKVRNLEFVAGGHGEGVNVGNAQRLAAIAEYITTGNDEKLSVFENARRQSKLVNVLSNVSWAVWLALAATLVLLGYWLSQFGTYGVVTYVVLLVLLLSSV